MFGWAGRVSDVLAVDPAALVSALSEASKERPSLAPSDSQITAWRNCARILQRELAPILVHTPSFANWSCVFEYELPRERGRRPDVVLLGAQTVLVLEFKDFAKPLAQHIDQVSAYARDLRHYHSECRDKSVKPVLVLTQATATFIVEADATIVSGDQLNELLAQVVSSDAQSSLIDCGRWLDGE